MRFRANEISNLQVHSRIQSLVCDSWIHRGTFFAFGSLKLRAVTPCLGSRFRLGPSTGGDYSRRAGGVLPAFD